MATTFDELTNFITDVVFYKMEMKNMPLRHSSYDHDLHDANIELLDTIIMESIHVGVKHKIEQERNTPFAIFSTLHDEELRDNTVSNCGLDGELEEDDHDSYEFLLKEALLASVSRAVMDSFLQ